MKPIICFIFILISIEFYGRTPFSYYVFQWNDISELYKFNSDERKLFAEKGVFKIEQKSYKNDLIISYYLNQHGNIDSSFSYNENKPKKIITKTFFKYNNNNQLISKVVNENNYFSYDSLAYDSIGRLIYLHKKIKHSNKEYLSSTLNLLNAFPDNVVLKSNDNSIRYTLNNKNECIRIESNVSPYDIFHNLIDSVSTNYINDSCFTKKYYFKNNTDSVYLLGKVDSYENNKIINSKTYTTTGGREDITVYIYNDKEQLLRIEEESGHRYITFITYYKNQGKTNGLVKDVIDFYGEGSNTSIYYKYFFRE